MLIKENEEQALRIDHMNLEIAYLKNNVQGFAESAFTAADDACKRKNDFDKLNLIKDSQSQENKEIIQKQQAVIKKLQAKIDGMTEAKDTKIRLLGF